MEFGAIRVIEGLRGGIASGLLTLTALV